MIPYGAILFLCIGGVGGGCISILFAVGLAGCEVISPKQGAYLIGATLLAVFQVFLLMRLGFRFLAWLPTTLVISWIFLDFIFKNVRELITLGRLSILDRKVSCKNRR